MVQLCSVHMRVLLYRHERHTPKRNFELDREVMHDKETTRSAQLCSALYTCASYFTNTRGTNAKRRSVLYRRAVRDKETTSSAQLCAALYTYGIQLVATSQIRAAINTELHSDIYREVVHFPD